MARKQGKKYASAAHQIERRPYTLEEAVPLVQSQVRQIRRDCQLLRLGVDPKTPTRWCVAPSFANSLGNQKYSIASQATSKGSGRGWGRFRGQRTWSRKSAELTDFGVSHPDMMRCVRAWKVLGPRGSCPNKDRHRTVMSLRPKEVKAGG
jgi:large subunit ribosomal protein L1